MEASGIAVPAKKLKPWVFFPPFLLLAAAIALNFLDGDRFSAALAGVYEWVLATFGWLVSLTAFAVVVVCALIYVSPLGRVVIGGPKAKPLLTRWQLFAIVLTTNIAIGILFWGPVEPLSYFSKPPISTGIAPNSPAAATFAMSTVLLHWTWTPYAIASLIGLMFAFAFYNMKRPFTLGAPLAPLLGKYSVGAGGHAIDALCLYALVLGMSASLSGAMMLIGGGVNHVLGIAGRPSDMTLGLIGGAILVASILAAISGVKKGILFIANINTFFLMGLLLFFFLFGPTRFILQFATEGLGNLLSHYFEKVLFTGAAHQDPWPQKWTEMQFSGWCAWAPIMSVFLGRIIYGHSVRTFLIFNILLPAFFTGVWMAILCGASLHMEIFQNAGLVANFDKNGVEGVLYAFMQHFPLAAIMVPVFLFTAFISFVTTADSNLSAMSGISSAGISPESPESSMFIKIAWGATIGVVAWIMATSARLEGIRMLSSLGGLPALFLCAAVIIAAVRVMLNPYKYDRFKEGYDAQGRPLYPSKTGT
ncbi:MAG: BCCT family transporter [Planctomycetota bacterium]|nr:BCCT family transporter [Planctomycetota bacterium]